ncbi:MAG: FAD-dependent oxidoreductase [Clostridia bacterium]|nr:FAD-dependent oxidoreductase [Clostridia bacterium]
MAFYIKAKLSQYIARIKNSNTKSSFCAVWQRPLTFSRCIKITKSRATLVRGLAIENGSIAIKRDCSTNIAGIFAAGDCTGRPYQYAKAAGEGNVAAHSAVEYIANLK